MSDGRRDFEGGKGWGGPILVSRDGEPVGTAGGSMEITDDVTPDQHGLRVGDIVEYLRDDGTRTRHRIGHPPTVFGNHKPVAWIDGGHGWVDVSRLHPTKEASP